MTDHRGSGVYRLLILALISLFLITITTVSAFAADPPEEQNLPRPRLNQQ